jgi:hypothetical protein
MAHGSGGEIIAKEAQISFADVASSLKLRHPEADVVQSRSERRILTKSFREI